VPRMTAAQQKAARLKTFRARLERIALEVEAARKPLLGDDLSEEDWNIWNDVRTGLEVLIEDVAAEMEKKS